MSLESTNGTVRSLEIIETPERTVDFSDATQLAQYEADVTEDYKRIFGKDREISNQKYLLDVHGPLTEESRAGLQAIGTLRVMFYQRDQVLRRVKENPKDAAVIAKLSRLDAKINDLTEVMNVAIEKQFANGNQSSEVVEDKAVPFSAPLVLEASARLSNNDAPSHDVVPSTTESSLEPFVLTPAERVADKPDTIDDVEATIQRLETEIAAHEVHKLYPQTITLMRESLDRATKKLADMRSTNVVKEEVEVVPVTLEEPTVTVESSTEMSAPPTQQSVNEAFRRQEDIEESVRTRLKLWWGKLLPKQRQMFLAILGAATLSPEATNQYAETFQTNTPIEASISGIGLNATWGSGVSNQVESPVTKLKVKEVSDAVSPEIAKVMVMPPIPEVMEESLDVPPVVPTEISSVSKSESVKLGVITAETPASVDTTMPTIAESLPNRYVGLVKHGQPETYPDNQLEKFFATVDTTKLPAAFVDRLKAQTKTAFYTDGVALRAAGFSTNDAKLVFDGEKINYEQPVEKFKSAVTAALQLLAAPHTEVVEEGTGLTNTILESFASDLAVIPLSDRAPLVAKALAAYEATNSDALATLNVASSDHVLDGTIVDLRPLASYLSAAIAEYAREQATISTENGEEADNTDTESETFDVETPDENKSVSPETYPGGELAFSKDYQTFLASLGINGVSSNWFDAMFTPAGPNTQRLLSETVGSLTELMVSKTTAERADALRELGVPEATVKRVYDVVVAERAAGRLPASLDTNTSIETVLRNYVLQTAVSAT
jgi:hypothetical protein